MNRYKFILLKEDFLKADIEKAIVLTCKILTKRLGKKVTPVFIKDFVVQSGKNLFGIIASVGNSQQIRFNFLIGSSASIISIDVWNSIKFQPDLNIVTSDISIVKIIDIIENALQQGQAKNFILAEDLSPKTQGKVSKDISDSINAWAKTMGIDDDKLAKTRMTDLYKDYSYWYQEVSDKTLKFVPVASFRNYLLAYFEKYNIKNIFTRTVSITTASKEKLAVSKSEKEEFDSSLYDLSLSDKFDFLRSSIVAVTRKYENALIISGMAGIGKSSTVKEILEEENVSYKESPSFIKNYTALYTFFYDNRDRVLVFDDVDDIFNKKYIGITNIALSGDKKRIIQFPSEFGKDLPKKYKKEFEFTGSIIIITNLKKNKIPASLASRGSVIEINVSIENKLDYIRQNIDKIMTEYPEATREVKLEVLDFIEKALKNIGQLDFRVFKRSVIFKLSGTPNWKKWVFTVLRAA
jgi:hypothetical protein